MGRKLGYLMAVAVLLIPATAAAKPGSISGYVKNSAGVPQMGAVVQVFATPASPATTVFTDARGFYLALDLLPGVYQVKVSAPSFLPSLRENVNLRGGASLVVNITLNTLFEAIQLLPHRNTVADEDEWKWTLRSTANRPILRVLDNGPLVVVSRTGGEDKTLKARLAFVAGSGAEGFGSTGDMSTNFMVERSIFNSGRLAFNGNLGYGDGPQGVLRASYSHQMSDGSTPEMALTVRRFATPDTIVHDGAMQALSLSLADSMTLANFIDLRFGTEFQTIQFQGRVSALRPFGSVDVHLSPTTVVEYQYATSEPNTRRSKGFDSAPADLSESNPRVTMADSNAVLERARHQEVSLSHRMGGTSVQVAAYRDNISNTALLGAGEVFGMEDTLLPDVYSGTFNYDGGQVDTNGVRVVVQQRITPQLTATVNYSYGGVLDLVGSGVDWSGLRDSIHQERRHAVAGKLNGVLPCTKTRWIASYKWTNRGSLNAVDMFNSSPGQTDPFLNLFLRQPLPSSSFLPGKIEALVDLRNLLAQGYVPVVANDGHTLYLVQSARSVRGGLAFVF